MPYSTARRAKPFVVAAVLVATTQAVACGGALRAFLDIPEPTPTIETAASAPAVLNDPAVVDTVRPAIEAILDPDSVIALLPKDVAGNIDWVAARREGVIRPRSALPGETPAPRMDGFRFDFLMKGPAPMFDAVFPHSGHVQELACESCHPRIFPYRNEPITMQAINGGEFCGQCHGKVAFPPATCERCHSAMSMGAGRMTPALLGEVVLARVSEIDLGYAPARFSHGTHRIRFECRTCHPDLFEMQAGADTVTMDMINQGQSCGACHDGRNAFRAGFGECERCHVEESAVPGPPQ